MKSNIIFSGPIASLFTNRYGCRIVTIAGAILAAAGLAASALATNITYLYFTIGVCTGEMFLIFVLLLIFSVLQLKCEKKSSNMFSWLFPSYRVWIKTNLCFL